MLTHDEIETLLNDLREQLRGMKVAPREIVIEAGESRTLGNGKYTIRCTEPYQPSPTGPVFLSWERTTDHELTSPTVQATVGEREAQTRQLLDGLRGKGA